MHVLHKEKMNIHPFNVSEGNEHQALHINVDLLPIGLRPFPVALLLRYIYTYTKPYAMAFASATNCRAVSRQGLACR